MTDPTGALQELARQLPQRLALPGSEDYRKAATPSNSSVRQEPLAVVLAQSAADVMTAIVWAAEVDVPVMVQATGHGAGREVADDTLMIHTAGLDTVEVDAQARTVRVGAGATSGAVNAVAWRSGLLFPGGTAPDVAVTGYTAWGGVGWLTRPHGLASAALLSVDVVDGSGRLLHADDDHHQDVLWAYRGGGGVGVATALTFRLFPAPQLWAGYALWPADHLDAVASAWGAALPDLHPALTTSLGMLLAPDAPSVPERLRGQRVVHLSAATVAGSEAGQRVLGVLAGVPAPALQTFGPADAERLATIHLDPPDPVPAIGLGRWLTAEAGVDVARVLRAAGAGTSGPIAELELRWVSHPPSGVAGAQTSAPGPLLLHATGAGADPASRQQTQQALDQVALSVAAFDAGGSASFSDGQQRTANSLRMGALGRLDEIRSRVDPDNRISASRSLE